MNVEGARERVKWLDEWMERVVAGKEGAAIQQGMHAHANGQLRWEASCGQMDEVLDWLESREWESWSKEEAA